MANLRSPCPVCGGSEIIPCISLAGVPVYCNVLYPSKHQALNADTGDIDLCACADCGHVFNAAFDSGRVDYSLEYENSLHFSGRFQQYATALAQDLVERYKLHGKTIVELACGKGDFLSEIVRMGGNRGVGFDPSYVPGRLSESDSADLTIIQDYYSDKYSDLKADLICCRHALEHIPEPQKFLATVRKAIGEDLATAVFFEVPNVMYTLRDMGIWDIIYEHCGYFSEFSLAEAFARGGFEVHSVKDAFGGQFLAIEATPSPNGAAAVEGGARQPAEEVSRYAREFEKRYQHKLQSWKGWFGKAREQEQRVAVWGAGSKGVTFLNVLQASDDVGYIVDLNPHKQGKFVPGTGHQVVAPEFLKEYRPDTVIVMNPLYEQEIRDSLATMGVEAEVLLE